MNPLHRHANERAILMKRSSIMLEFFFTLLPTVFPVLFLIAAAIFFLSVARTHWINADLEVYDPDLYPEQYWTTFFISIAYFLIALILALYGLQCFMHVVELSLSHL